jgi:Zn-dependent protease with chaperone function
MARPGRRLAAVVLGSLLLPGLLASCADVQRTLGRDGGGTTGQAAGAPGTSSGSTARAAPAGAERTRGFAADDQIHVVGKTVIIPSAVITDPSCNKLVAPYTLTENFTILAELGLKEAQDNIGQMFQQWISGTSSRLAQQNVMLSARHRIPYKLRAAAYRMNWLPMEAEVMYGQKVLDRLRDGGKLVPEDTRIGRALYPKARQLLDDVLKGVDEPHDYTFHIHVGSDAGQNAVALPGGFIVVDQALLQKPELARKGRFAVAHEVAHVLQRHETRELQARIIDIVSMRAGVQDLAKVIGEAREKPAVVVALALTGKLSFERFHSRQELHSDGCAVRTLKQSMNNDTELLAVLRAFIAGLPPPRPEKTPDPADPAAAGGASSRGTQADAKADARQAAQAMKNVDSLVDLVTRPIDRHPTTQERVDNLNARLREVQGRATAGKVDPKSLPAAKARPSKTAASAAETVGK